MLEDKGWAWGSAGASFFHQLSVSAYICESLGASEFNSGDLVGEFGELQEWAWGVLGVNLGNLLVGFGALWNPVVGGRC